MVISSSSPCRLRSIHDKCLQRLNSAPVCGFTEPSYRRVAAVGGLLSQRGSTWKCIGEGASAASRSRNRTTPCSAQMGLALVDSVIPAAGAYESSAASVKSHHNTSHHYHTTHSSHHKSHQIKSHHTTSPGQCTQSPCLGQYGHVPRRDVMSPAFVLRVPGVASAPTLRARLPPPVIAQAG